MSHVQTADRAVLARFVEPIEGPAAAHEALMARIGDARVVLLGEASHGTEEFYRERAAITRRLISEKGFTAVAVEADWPDAYRVHEYVGGSTADRDGRAALAGFERFPTWMWRNTEVLEFVEWLRAYNDALPSGARKVGFFGLDLYSLYRSVEAILRYLDRIDPEAARRARDRYSCFERFGDDVQAYGYAAEAGMVESCESEVIAQLVDLQRRAVDYASRDGRVAEEAYFYTEQNARLVRNAEEYYRSVFRGRASSWNLRDRHMAETLESLHGHLERRGSPVKIAVWEHNSHIGDARATEMGAEGEWNVGQLVREKYGAAARLIGFTTYAGTVTAASDWNNPAERKRVRPALPGSYEVLFHETGVPQFFLDLRRREAAAELRGRRLERAIGVIYRPETERASHYFLARLPEQFDAVLHFDHTRAVEPLEATAGWKSGALPETYQSGM